MHTELGNRNSVCLGNDLLSVQEPSHYLNQLWPLGTNFSEVFNLNRTYYQTSNTIHTLVGNKIVDPSDVVGASPVGAAPITSSFST